MLTTRLQTVHASVATTRGSSSEQIWTGLHSVGHQMSGGRSQIWCGVGGEVGPRSDVQRGGGILPCYLSRDVFDVTYPLPIWTDTRENINFPQLRLHSTCVRISICHVSFSVFHKIFYSSQAPIAYLQHLIRVSISNIGKQCTNWYMDRNMDRNG